MFNIYTTINKYSLFWNFALVNLFKFVQFGHPVANILGRTLANFNQLKRNKRFDNSIMLVWVKWSLIHIAARSHPVQKAGGGSQDSLYRGQIQKLLQWCKKHTKRFFCYNDSVKSIVWPIYDVPFRSYWRKGQRAIFWLYRGQTGKYTPILLAMVSKCSSCKYNSNSE